MAQTISFSITAGSSEKYRVYGWADPGGSCGDFPPNGAPFKEGQGNWSSSLSDASWPSIDSVTYCLWIMSVGDTASGTKDCGMMP